MCIYTYIGGRRAGAVESGGICWAEREGCKQRKQCVVCQQHLDAARRHTPETCHGPDCRSYYDSY